MNDRPANGAGYTEPVFADIDAATRRLERTNREIAERLDAAIGSIRAVLDDDADAGVIE